MSSPTIQQVLALQQAGRHREAELACRQILARSPAFGAAQHLLGLLCHQSGRQVEALQLIQQAIANHPSQPEFHTNLAAVLGSLGRYDEAIDSLQQAIMLRPQYAPSHHNLGVTLERLGRFDQAETAFRRAVELQPDEARFHLHLGSVLRRQRRSEEAAACYHNALKIEPGLFEACTALASLEVQRGSVEGTIAFSRRGVALRPNDPIAHSNLLFSLQYDPSLTAEQLYREHKAWAIRHEGPCRDGWRPHDNDRVPQRRLRVGYVSADFREHTRMRFMEGILGCHDHEAFEVFCYSDVRRPDQTTARVRKHADVWRETSGMTHDKLAELIRRDRIDILVELTGHMGGNRLPAFARKPAPVQVAYPGYPATTGLSAIDYLITDHLRDPPGSERLYSESLVFLDPTSQCYSPGSGENISVAPSPCLTAGYVVFGSLNKPVKVNPPVVAVWSKILTFVPRSRLMLLATERDQAKNEHSILGREFARHGIGADRLIWAPMSSRPEYLNRHAQMDIALDPWPYNGHTTTLDALWMGVPVVALAGHAHVARESSSILSLLGLGELIGRDADDYVAIAVRLASNCSGLAELRATMRDRLLRSPIADAPAVTRKVEGVFRRVWDQWGRR